MNRKVCVTPLLFVTLLMIAATSVLAQPMCDPSIYIKYETPIQMTTGMPGDRPVEVAAADIDNNQLDDFIVLNQGSGYETDYNSPYGDLEQPGNIAVLRATGPRSWASAEIISLGDYENWWDPYLPGYYPTTFVKPHSLTVADVTGDGAKDILFIAGLAISDGGFDVFNTVVYRRSQRLVMIENAGDGTFLPARPLKISHLDQDGEGVGYIRELNPVSLVAEDFTGDGLTDLFLKLEGKVLYVGGVAEWFDTDHAILIPSNDNGSFPEYPDFIVEFPEELPSAVQFVEDVNQDGLLDIVTRESNYELLLRHSFRRL